MSGFPNGSWHHWVESTLMMACTYQQAASLAITLDTALRVEGVVAPSHVQDVTDLRDFLKERTRILRRVTEEPV